MIPAPSEDALVLYADDDADDRVLVREAFSPYREHIRLMEFENGYQLLNFLKRYDPELPGPCLIILDINMAGLSGKDTLRLLRQVNGFEHTPVILFTTSNLPADLFFARQFKAGFMIKPMVTRQMNELVREFLSHCSEETRKQVTG